MDSSSIRASGKALNIVRDGIPFSLVEHLPRKRNVREHLTESEKINRRTSIKYAGGAVIAAALGAVAGYGLGTTTAPAPQMVKTVTETATVGGETKTISITAAPTNPYGAPKYKIDIIGYCLGSEFGIPMWNSVPDAAALFGCEVAWLGPSECDPKGMFDVAAIEEARKPDAIMAYEDQAPLQKYTQEWLGKGIPVISYLVDDAPPHPSGRLAYVGTTQYDAAMGTAKVFIEKYLKPKGITSGNAVLFIHRPGAPDLEDRIKGFSDALKAAGITAIAQPAGPEATQGDEMAEAYLRAHTDVVCAAGVDGISTPATGRAIDVLGLKDKVLGFGFDLIPRSLDYMQKGALLALANQQPYVIIPVAVMSLYMHLVSNKEIAPFDANTGRGVITLDNLAQFLKKSKYH